jgi:hypothetical protein
MDARGDTSVRTVTIPVVATTTVTTGMKVDLATTTDMPPLAAAVATPVETITIMMPAARVLVGH